MENNTILDLQETYGTKKELVQSSPVLEGEEGELRQLLSNSIKQVGSLMNQITSTRKNPNPYRVYLTDGISPTLSTAQGGGRTPCIVI